MEKKCLDCGEPIIGRADKKFCSDQCRSNYYHRTNKNEIRYVRKVNTILKHNRSILARLNPKGKSKIHKEQLLKEGFNFSFITNTYITKAGTTYYFCYEHGYLPLDNSFYFLVKRNEN